MSISNHEAKLMNARLPVIYLQSPGAGVRLQKMGHIVPREKNCQYGIDIDRVVGVSIWRGGRRDGRLSRREHERGQMLNLL